MSPSRPAASAQTAYLGLGSNLGDRRANLARAVALLGHLPGSRIAALSSIYATEPAGLREQPEFLNAAAAVETPMDPLELLDACLEIERELGRTRDVRWGPRTIDIDLLLHGGQRLSGGRLELPHPRMRERAFVLLPLAEIAPGVLLEGKPVADWAAEADRRGVRRAGAFSA